MPTTVVVNGIVIKCGLAAGIPVGASGEPLWTTDTHQFFIGTGAGNVLIGGAPGSPGGTPYITNVPPTVSDDNTAGFGIGSHWIDMTEGEDWECFDATTGAAVWFRTVGYDGGFAGHEFNLVGSGGVVMGGAGVMPFELVGSGGLLIGGGGVIDSPFVLTGSGGLVVGGGGDYTVPFVLTGSGGIVMGGGGSWVYSPPCVTSVTMLASYNSTLSDSSLTLSAVDCPRGGLIVVIAHDSYPVIGTDIYWNGSIMLQVREWNDGALWIGMYRLAVDSPAVGDVEINFSGTVNLAAVAVLIAEDADSFGGMLAPNGADGTGTNAATLSQAAALACNAIVAAAATNSDLTAESVVWTNGSEVTRLCQTGLSLTIAAANSQPAGTYSNDVTFDNSADWVALLGVAQFGSI